MVTVSPAPGIVSALTGGHVFLGGDGRGLPGTVPNGAPFPFAGVPNVPGSSIGARTPIPTAAPKTNVGIPYAREVSAEFAQRPNNLTTTLAGDPLFVGTFVAPVRMGAQHFVHAASVEYMNDMLKLPENTHTATRNANAQADKVTGDTIVEAFKKKELEDVRDRKASFLGKRRWSASVDGEFGAKAQATKKGKNKEGKEINVPVDAEANGILKAQEKREEFWDNVERDNKNEFNPKTDFLAENKVFKQFRLDGMVRSIDMDGTPLATMQGADARVHNASDSSHATLVNVIVQGPARCRVVDGVGLNARHAYADRDSGYATQTGFHGKRNGITVFDELVLALYYKYDENFELKPESTDDEGNKIKAVTGARYVYQIRRSKRTHYSNTMPMNNMQALGTRDEVGDGKVVFENMKEDENMVGYWRLGRVVEEPNKTDQTCGILFDGKFVWTPQTKLDDVQGRERKVVTYEVPM